jgi:hypothetical protein
LTPTDCAAIFVNIYDRKRYALTTLRIPGVLRPMASGAAELVVQADSIAEALAELTSKHPALRRHLFDDGGILRGFINV